MSFFAELKRRNVVRVGVAYVLIAWVALQGADFVLDLVGAPDWVIRALTGLAIIGLPAVLAFSWIFEMTPEGLKRESEIDRSASITPQTGRKLDRVIIAVLAVAVVVLIAERFLPGSANSPAGNANTTARSATPIAPPSDAAPGRSIAVLPFVNMSADPDNEYFSDGVSEEILNVLAAVPDLKVASRTSAFRYKGSDLPIQRIAEELGVTHVLEGSVRKAGDQVRITAQLIQADDGFHLWSDSYDRQLTNIFAIQDEIAGSIAEVLQVQLLGDSKSYVTVQDLSPENYEKFLKARFLMRQRSDAAMAEAITLTEAVLRDAPEFPLGLAQLAEARVQQLAPGDVAEEQDIEALADRALALEPDLAAAHMINGNLAMFRSESEAGPLEAYRHLQRAIELDPSEPRPHHWQGLNLSNAGYLERAKEELEIAVQLEPDHANANGYLGIVLLLLGDLDGAERQFELQHRLGNDFGALRSIHVAVMRGDYAAAQRLLEQRQGIDPVLTKRMALWIEAARDSAALPAYLDHVSASGGDQWYLALELMILGRYDEALAQEVGSYPRLAWAERWAEARNLPRFREMIEVTNLPRLWDVLGPPPACRKIGSGYDCSPRRAFE